MAVPKGGVPKPQHAADQDPAASFIAGATGKEVLPWQRPGVRDDLGKQSNVTLSEKLTIQIEWLADLHGTTKRATIERALREFVERELRAKGLEP